MPRFQEDFVEPHVVEEHELSEFIGNVYNADNKAIWGFDSGDPTNKRHPGACYGILSRANEALLLKGTSQEPSERYRASYVSVFNNETNGLDKETYFRLRSYQTRWHRMRSLHGYGLRGRLSDADLMRLQEGMSYTFRYDGEDS